MEVMDVVLVQPAFAVLVELEALLERIQQRQALALQYVGAVVAVQPGAGKPALRARSGHRQREIRGQRLAG